MCKLSSNKTKKFVEYVIRRANIEQDKGFSAKLKKADNEATEYQSWEILANWTNLEYAERKAYALIGATAARSKRKIDGNMSLGRALRGSVQADSNPEDSSAASRLRRILAIQDSDELIRVLRSTLRFLDSKEQPLDYARLLDEILWFNHEEVRDKIRSRWAQDFYKPWEKAE